MSTRTGPLPVLSSPDREPLIPLRTPLHTSAPMGPGLARARSSDLGQVNLTRPDELQAPTRIRLGSATSVPPMGTPSPSPRSYSELGGLARGSNPRHPLRLGVLTLGCAPPMEACLRSLVRSRPSLLRALWACLGGSIPPRGFGALNRIQGWVPYPSRSALGRRHQCPLPRGRRAAPVCVHGLVAAASCAAACACRCTCLRSADTYG